MTPLNFLKTEKIFLYAQSNEIKRPEINKDDPEFLYVSKND